MKNRYGWTILVLFSSLSIGVIVYIGMNQANW